MKILGSGRGEDHLPWLPIFPVVICLFVFENLKFYFPNSTSCVEFYQFWIRKCDLRTKNCPKLSNCPWADWLEFLGLKLQQKVDISSRPKTQSQKRQVISKVVMLLPQWYAHAKCLIVNFPHNTDIYMRGNSFIWQARTCFLGNGLLCDCWYWLL